MVDQYICECHRTFSIPTRSTDWNAGSKHLSMLLTTHLYKQGPVSLSRWWWSCSSFVVQFPISRREISSTKYYQAICGCYCISFRAGNFIHWEGIFAPFNRRFQGLREIYRELVKQCCSADNSRELSRSRQAHTAPGVRSFRPRRSQMT